MRWGSGSTSSEGEGPRLDPIRSAAELARLNPGATRTKFALVCETVARLRQDLPHDTALIGFCGAPWTVATYMVGGQGSPDQREARLWAYRDRAGFAGLIDILVEASIDYLSLQVEAGADVLQIFDTWAGSLPPPEFEAWVVAPTRRIVTRDPSAAPARADHRLSARSGAEDRALRRRDRRAGRRLRHRHGRGAHEGPCRTPEMSSCRAISIRWRWLRADKALERQVDALLRGLAGVPHIFNLGHGILPETPPEHVARLVGLVRGQG